MPAKKILSVMCFLLLMIHGICWSQATTGGIRGQVNDDEGKAIPGAIVTISSSSLIGKTRSTTTNELGVFRFPGLPVGTYSIEVTLEGFDKVTTDNIQVSLDTVANVPLNMRLAGQEESLVVMGEAPVLDVTDSSVATTYNEEILENTPTQRNFYNLMQVSPGVSASTDDNQTDRTIAFGSNMQSNSWNVDGLEATAPETGSTWMYVNPDSIEEIQVLGVGAPAEYGNHTGAVFNVVTKKGGNEFHGGASYFFQNKDLIGTNVTQNNEICLAGQQCESFNLDKYFDASGSIGGPIVKDQAWFYGSAQFLRDASTDPGVPPDIATEVVSDRFNVKGSGLIGQNNAYTGFYQYENGESPDSASPYVAPSAVYQENSKSHGWGGGITSTLSENTLLEINYAGWDTHDLQMSPTGDLSPRFTEFSPPGGGPPVYTGGNYFPFDYKTGRDQLNGKMTHYAENFLKTQHEFRFGVQWSRGVADTPGSAYGADGYYLTHYNYAGTDYWYQYQLLPFQYGAITKDLGIFLDDTITLSDRLTLNVGVRFDHNTGDIQDFNILEVGTPSFTPVGNFVDTGVTVPGHHVMTWNKVSPRLGFVWQARENGRSVLQGSFGVYYDHNVSGNWDFPSPTTPPSRLFLSTTSIDGPYELIDEQTFLGGVDPDIEPPRTLQYSIGYEHQFNDTISAGITYVYKDTKNLIGWQIIGGEWEQVPFTDPVTGTSYTLLSLVGASPTVRKGNEPFPEGIPDFSGDTDPYFQKYNAVLITFTKNFSNNWALNASYTWSKSEGLIPRMLGQTQFNPFYRSSEGRDPNNYVNAEGLLQGDRPNMFRIQGVFHNLPWELESSVAVDFSDGRHHTRQMRVTSDFLGQGAQTVIMERDFRLEAVQTIDVSIGRPINVGPNFQIVLEGTVFNLLNTGNDLELATQRFNIGEDPVFVPTLWTRPRRLALQVGVQF